MNAPKTYPCGDLHEVNSFGVCRICAQREALYRDKTPQAGGMLRERALKLAIAGCREHRDHPDNHFPNVECVMCEPYVAIILDALAATPAPAGIPNNLLDVNVLNRLKEVRATGLAGIKAGLKEAEELYGAADEQAAPAPHGSEQPSRAQIVGLPYIIKLLESDLVNARDNLYRASMQQKRMPFDHDNNDFLEKYKKWADQSLRALESLRKLTAQPKPEQPAPEAKP